MMSLTVFTCRFSTILDTVRALIQWLSQDESCSRALQHVVTKLAINGRLAAAAEPQHLHTMSHAPHSEEDK